MNRAMASKRSHEDMSSGPQLISTSSDFLFHKRSRKTEAQESIDQLTTMQRSNESLREKLKRLQIKDFIID